MDRLVKKLTILAQFAHTTDNDNAGQTGSIRHERAGGQMAQLPEIRSEAR
jgi:hypothetical protein